MKLRFLRDNLQDLTLLNFQPFSREIQFLRYESARYAKELCNNKRGVT